MTSHWSTRAGLSFVHPRVTCRENLRIVRYTHVIRIVTEEHPVVRAHLTGDVQKGTIPYSSPAAPEILKRLRSPLCDNLLSSDESDTPEGLTVSLRPHGMVLQKDAVRTSTWPAVGSCHLGAHLEALQATRRSQLSPRGPWHLRTHRATLAPFSRDGEWGLKTTDTDKGE